MSAVKLLKQAADLLAGRWQIPLALAAVVVGSVTLWRVIPQTPPVNFDVLLAELTLLEDAGETVAASDAAANLLATEPPLPPAQQAVLHERLAELIYRVERDLPVHNPDNARKLLAHRQAAAELGAPASPAAQLHAALAHQWLGEEDAALNGFRAVLDQPLPAEERRAAVQALVTLLEKRPEARVERQQVLENLLGDENVPAAYMWWGLQRSLRDALDANDTLRARELLTRHGQRLTSSDLKGYRDYLDAWIMLHEGRAEEAAPLVQWVDKWLGAEARTATQLDEFGHLPSLNRWLMGQIHLALGHPQEALESFDQALEWQADPDLRVAAAIGRGLALSGLGRHAAACAAFRAALDTARATCANQGRALRQLREALVQGFERQRAGRDYAGAAEYLTLAAELNSDDRTEQQANLLQNLGEVCQEAAAQVGDPDSRRAFHARAAQSFERAAGRVEFDEPRLAELLWSGADEYDQAGQGRAARRMLERFVEGRAEHPRCPRAMVRLGQTCEAGGDADAALVWYGRAVREYPNLEEAARAKVLMADALLTQGAEHADQAEQTLVSLLSDDHIAPDAAVYRDGLLSLGELLYRNGRYGEAISRVEDFLARYPDSVERARARFMLADAYRRSAYALRDRPPAGAKAEAAAESRVRFARAAELFGRLLVDLEGEAQPEEARTSARAAPDGDRHVSADEKESVFALYQRLALFYRGDCLFELNEPDALRDALAAYRTAAARYEGQPAALTAQVQIANALLRLGEVTEAGRAVERARWLLRNMPAEAFASSAGGSRADWERLLSVVRSSRLFEEAFGDSR
jgi:tetratricopeptide (TPR) repeat protein